MAQNLGEYIAAQVRQAINQALQDNQAQITAWFKDAGGNVNVNLGGGVGSLADVLTAALLGVALTDPPVAAALGAIGAAEGAAGGLGTSFGIGYFLASIGFQIAQPALAGAQYAVHAAVGDARLDAATVARMYAKSIMNPSQAASEVADQGYSGGRLNQLYLDALRYPGLPELLELWRRGVIDETGVTFALEQQGLSPDYNTFARQLKGNLLSPADLALATLRSFIDPGTAKAGQAFSQGLNGISGQTGYDMLGISDQDFQLLLDNTGEPPGLEEMLFMYRLGIIPKTDPDPKNPSLEQGIRESRVRNEWIPPLEKFRLRPMSTADAIRARVENYWTDADAQPVTEQNGLDPAHYPILVEAFGRPLSLTEMSSLYHRGLALEADVKQAVRESDIKDKYVDAAFELTKRLMSERYIDLGVEFGSMGKDEALTRLMQLGYVQADAELILDLGQAQHHSKQKDLTASNITALYVDKLITKHEALTDFDRIGYKRAVAEAELDLADYNNQAKLARIAQAEIRAAYLKADLTKQEAIDRLTKGGTPRDLAVELIDEWDLTHRPTEKELSESQVVKAAEAAIITPQEAHDRLVGLGYGPGDATIILNLAGLLPYHRVPQSGGPGGGDTGGGGPGGGPGL